MTNQEISISGSIEMIRKKVVEEWGLCPYRYQIFNEEESPNWRYPMCFSESQQLELLNEFQRHCADFRSFNFSIESVIVGGVRLCSYSELQKITDFKDENILRKTLSGRLFHGIIGEGSEQRRAFVKTWDFLLPMRDGHAQLLPKFCDEIELFTDEKANTHQNLVKLCMFCCDKRLAAVYECDEKFTRLLSDVLLDDEFGWDDRIKVATQLADLLAFLHEKGTAVGCVTASCIMIDEDMNIKVFDFGYVSCHVNEDSKIPFEFVVGREAPESGMRTMKSDVYIFGLLLLELITKKELEYSFLPAAKRGKINLVDESFKEVPSATASAITLLAYSCTDLDPLKRPKMKHIVDVLRAWKMPARGEKRKREDEVEKATALLA